MVRKKVLAFFAVVAVLSLLLAACGSKGGSGEEILGLADWSLSASVWSSPNGATVHLSATPAGYAKGQSAAFVVRLEGEDVENIPCKWDGKHYTASADLNGEDGYCYYVLMTAATGDTAEIPVNIPSDPTDETLINLAFSLTSTCSLVVESSDYDGKWLTITGGQVTVRPPQLVSEGKTVTCDKAVLILSLDGQESSQVALELPGPAEDGSYLLELKDTAFQAPAMEDDQQLSVDLSVTLSNGQTLSAPGGIWFYNGGSLMMSVG